MTNEPADINEAGPDTDKAAPLGLPAEPIDTDPAGNYPPKSPGVPDVDDVPIEQGSGGNEE